MRYCYTDKRLEFHNKSAPPAARSHLPQTTADQEALITMVRTIANNKKNHLGFWPLGCTYGRTAQNLIRLRIRYWLCLGETSNDATLAR